MTCVPLVSNGKRCGFICMPSVYEYKGWVFEDSMSNGPWPLKKDLEPRKRAGRKFWGVYASFLDIPEDEREQYRVG